MRRQLISFTKQTTVLRLHLWYIAFFWASIMIYGHLVDHVVGTNLRYLCVFQAICVLQVVRMRQLCCFFAFLGKLIGKKILSMPMVSHQKFVDILQNFLKSKSLFLFEGF